MDTVWNVVTGCTPIYAGCDYCYAQRMSKRLAGRCGYDKDAPFNPTFHWIKLIYPKTIKNYQYKEQISCSYIDRSILEAKIETLREIERSISNLLGSV